MLKYILQTWELAWVSLGLNSDAFPVDVNHSAFRKRQSFLQGFYILRERISPSYDPLLKKGGGGVHRISNL